MSLGCTLARFRKSFLSFILWAVSNLLLSPPNEFLSCKYYTSLRRSSIWSHLNLPGHFYSLLFLARTFGISFIHLHILNILILYPATDKSNVWSPCRSDSKMCPFLLALTHGTLFRPCFLSEFLFDLIYAERDPGKSLFFHKEFVFALVRWQEALLYYHLKIKLQPEVFVVLFCFVFCEIGNMNLLWNTQEGQLSVKNSQGIFFTSLPTVKFEADNFPCGPSFWRVPSPPFNLVYSLWRTDGTLVFWLSLPSLIWVGSYNMGGPPGHQD